MTNTAEDHKRLEITRQGGGIGGAPRREALAHEIALTHERKNRIRDLKKRREEVQTREDVLLQHKQAAKSQALVAAKTLAVNKSKIVDLEQSYKHERSKTTKAHSTRVRSASGDVHDDDATLASGGTFGDPSGDDSSLRESQSQGLDDGGGDDLLSQAFGPEMAAQMPEGFGELPVVVGQHISKVKGGVGAFAGRPVEAYNTVTQASKLRNLAADVRKALASHRTARKAEQQQWVMEREHQMETAHFDR